MPNKEKQQSGSSSNMDKKAEITKFYPIYYLAKLDASRLRTILYCFPAKMNTKSGNKYTLYDKAYECNALSGHRNGPLAQMICVM